MIRDYWRQYLEFWSRILPKRVVSVAEKHPKKIVSVILVAILEILVGGAVIAAMWKLFF